MSIFEQYDPVIGLEIHVQLNTNTKLFSRSASLFGQVANSCVCEYDIAIPGQLPVMNFSAVEKAIGLGYAIDSQIMKYSAFDRKNYFYPDLPKGYQISQHFHPILIGGEMQINREDGTNFKVGIESAHLEEDAGKLIHDLFDAQSAVDLNRAGTPLLEIVTKPEINSSHDARVFLKTLHNLVCELGISDGNMAEGSLRCDVNVSVKKKESEVLGTRVETKNVNSFKFVAKVIEYEFQRQVQMLEQGMQISQETRQYDVKTDTTNLMRSKENAPDYKYFPDPDLPPLILTDEQIKQVVDKLPELPQQRKLRLKQTFKISEALASAIGQNMHLSEQFEKLCEMGVSHIQSANFVTNEIGAIANKHKVEVQDVNMPIQKIAQLLLLLEQEKISVSNMRVVAEKLHQGLDEELLEHIERSGMLQMNDEDQLESMLQQVLDDNPNQLAQYKAGKERLKGFFIGQIMKKTAGKANAKTVNDLFDKLTR